MTNVADKLRTPGRRWPWIVGVVAGVGIVVSAVIAGPSIAANMNAAPTATPTASEYAAVLSPAELDSVQQSADDQAAKIAADQKAAAAAAEAQAAADAAAVAAQQHHSSSVTAGARGSHVPFIASSDPNNANGGDYEDPGTYCDSHSASGNPPVCD